MLSSACGAGDRGSGVGDGSSGIEGWEWGSRALGGLNYALCIMNCALPFVLRPLSIVHCPLSSPLLGTKKCTESGALRITKNSSAKLQKVVEIAKFFSKKISTNFRFGKLFGRVRKLKRC